MNIARTEHHLLPVFSLLLTASMWGLVWYPLRLLEQAGLGGLWSSLVSYGTLLVLFAWLLVRERRQLAAYLPGLVMLGLGAGWCNVAFILAVLEGNVVRVLLLFYLSPFWAVVLGWFLLDERLDRQSLLVFVLAVVGALTMLWNEEVGVPWPRGPADWLAVSSGFGFALSNVYVRRLQAVSVSLKSACSWVGVVLVAVAWIVLLEPGVPAAGARVWLGAVALGLCGFLVMTFAVQYGVTRMPVHRSAVILLFELVVGAVSSLLLTDETVLAREWFGGALIVLAAWLAARIHAGESV
jgi:drug/metabolite transporter (DMT)-like permease